MTEPRPGPHLTVLSRAECELCEHLLAELRSLAARVPLPPVELVDVDSDPLARAALGPEGASAPARRGAGVRPAA